MQKRILFSKVMIRVFIKKNFAGEMNCIQKRKGFFNEYYCNSKDNQRKTSFDLARIKRGSRKLTRLANNLSLLIFNIISSSYLSGNSFPLLIFQKSFNKISTKQQKIKTQINHILVNKRNRNLVLFPLPYFAK